MKRVRRFTSAGWLKGRGKRVTHTQPYQYETLNLAPIRMWSMDKVGRFVQRRIEGRNATKEMTPPCEYLGTDREYLCNYCPVRDLCTRMNEGNDSAA
ncbi:MAG TPA: hypothetical protein VF510_02395 [Ktedonobacterales bacterium]